MEGSETTTSEPSIACASSELPVSAGLQEQSAAGGPPVRHDRPGPSDVAVVKALVHPMLVGR